MYAALLTGRLTCDVEPCCWLQERRHDASRGMGLLVEDWVSRASALQRKGRAGRVQEGICFSLFTKQRFEHQMRKFQVGDCAAGCLT